MKVGGEIVEVDAKVVKGNNWFAMVKKSTGRSMRDLLTTDSRQSREIRQPLCLSSCSPWEPVMLDQHNRLSAGTKTGDE